MPGEDRPRRSRALIDEMLVSPTSPTKAVKAISSVTRTTSKRRDASSAATTRVTPPEPTRTTPRPTKRKKVAPPPTPPPTIPRPLTRAYEPSLLPTTLSFSLSAAKTHLTAHDPRFGQMFKHLSIRPFQPPYTAIDPFKTLVTSIIGQQVSWMAAKAINKRFKALFGFDDEEGFPGPGEVAKGEVLVFKGAGLSTRKAEYVIELARHFLDGRLSTELLRDGSDEEISRALIAVRGIGQWTVDMFLMFSLRRPDILPVGDLGVQKGLLRWILAAHEALPLSKGKGKVNPDSTAKYAIKDLVDENGDGEIDTLVKRATTPPPGSKPGIPPTPVTPNGSAPALATLHTPGMPQVPPTPIIPAETLEVSAKQLPPPAPESLLAPLPSHPTWNVNRAAPLVEGLTIEILKSRLSGKKVKGGAYLTSKEMEAITDGWKPYRSLGIYYMWPAGEEF